MPCKVQHDLPPLRFHLLPPSPLSHSLPAQTPYCSSCIPGMFLPQGLCTHSALCQGHALQVCEWLIAHAGYLPPLDICSGVTLSRSTSLTWNSNSLLPGTIFLHTTYHFWHSRVLLIAYFFLSPLPLALKHPEKTSLLGSAGFCVSHPPVFGAVFPHLLVSQRIPGVSTEGVSVLQRRDGGREWGCLGEEEGGVTAKVIWKNRL